MVIGHYVSKVDLGFLEYLWITGHHVSQNISDVKIQFPVGLNLLLQLFLCLPQLQSNVLEGKI